MGACLSCLGLRSSSQSTSDRERLLYDEFPPRNGYGTWGQVQHPTLTPEDLMTPEEIARENDALDEISRKASKMIIEVFPSTFAMRASGMMNQHANGTGMHSTSEMQQEILRSMIPGSAARGSIKIHPASRPTSKSGLSVRSKDSTQGGTSGLISAKKNGFSALATLDIG